MTKKMSVNGSGISNLKWCTIILSLLMMADSAWAKDWPQWRGPNRDGIGDADGFIDTWTDADAPKPAWNARVGIGYSSMSVVGDKVYTMGWEDGKDSVLCIDINNGKELWRYSYASPKWDNMHKGGPACTPAITQGMVFTVSREALLVAVDAATGAEKWTKDLKKDLGLSVPRWGFSGSPLILGKNIVIDVGRIVTLEAANGNIVWQTHDYGAGYSSPVAFKHDDKQLLAVFPAAGLAILDSVSGKEIAQHGWKTSYEVNAPTPIINGDRVFIASGYGRGGAMLQLKDGKLNVLWPTNEMRSQMASPVLIDGHLYGFDEKVFKCLDAQNGTRRWAGRGIGAGALMAAGNKLVVISEDGELMIAKATPKGFEPTGKIKRTFSSGGNWTAPLLVNGRLVARGNLGEMVCYDLRKK